MRFTIKTKQKEIGVEAEDYGIFGNMVVFFGTNSLASKVFSINTSRVVEIRMIGNPKTERGQDHGESSRDKTNYKESVGTSHKASSSTD